MFLGDNLPALLALLVVLGVAQRVRCGELVPRVEVVELVELVGLIFRELTAFLVTIVGMPVDIFGLVSVFMCVPFKDKVALAAGMAAAVLVGRLAIGLAGRDVGIHEHPLVEVGAAGVGDIDMGLLRVFAAIA